LRNLRIGQLRSARYFEPFDSDKGIEKNLFNDYETAFRALQHQRYDALIIPERQGRFLLQHLGMDFRASTFQVPGLPSFITISRNSRLLKHKLKIEQVMSELKSEGFFERLIQVYLE